MRICVAWYTDDRFPDQSLIHWKFSTGWTWQDFKEAETSADMLFNSVSHNVHTLADFWPNAGAPSSGAITVLTRSLRQPHSNCGCIATIALPMPLLGAEHLIRRMMPQMARRVIIAPTLTAALDAICAQQSRC